MILAISKSEYTGKRDLILLSFARKISQKDMMSLHEDMNAIVGCDEAAMMERVCSTRMRTVHGSVRALPTSTLRPKGFPKKRA